MPEQNEQSGAGALNADAIQNLVADTVAAAIKPLSDNLAQLNESRGAASVRDRYISEKLADLPPAYQAQMPRTDDGKLLASEEQRIRTAFRADMAKLGVKLPDVSGAAPQATTGTQAPSAVPGGIQASATENIAAGLSATRGTPGGGAGGGFEQQRAAEVARAGAAATGAVK